MYGHTQQKRYEQQVMVGCDDRQGLEGVYNESELPLLIRRAGMADWQDGMVTILDRRKLPQKEAYLECRTPGDVATAIEDMAIQGAFSSAIAAGYGLALSNTRDVRNIRDNAERLINTRPTGKALKRMITACLEKAESALRDGGDAREQIVSTVDGAAENLARQGWKTGQRMAEQLEDGATVLTHCFPDRSYVYLLLEAARSGKTLRVICSETRPYLQGARLTALCAQEAGFNTSIVSDGMGGFLMRRGDIDAFVTAADRVCMDGTVCNKIGTYQYALAAQANDVPYYVLRQSGPDLDSPDESAIEIEWRNGDALLSIEGNKIAPTGVTGIYPAFDITPPQLIHAIVTDRGIFDPTDIHQYPATTAFVEDAIL